MSLKVAILQYAFYGGGGTRVLVAIVEALNKMNITPEIYAYKYLTQNEINAKFNKKIKFKIIKMNDYGIKGFGMYKAAFINYLASKKGYDVLINLDNNFYFMDKNRKTINYVHYPQKMSIKQETNILKRIYMLPFRVLGKYEKTNNLGLIYVNSEYTMDALIKAYGKNLEMKASVLYPPVDFNIEQSLGKKKNNNIVTIGRFCEDKNQISQIKIAEKLPNYNFKIIGQVIDDGYFNTCKAYIESRNINNVELFPNLDFKTLNEIVKESKYFLHTMIGEHFGIVTVEAIAAGCIPIVHDSGGQREIVEISELRFNNYEDVPNLLKKIEKVDSTVIVSQLQKSINKYHESHFIDVFIKDFVNLIE